MSEQSKQSVVPGRTVFKLKNGESLILSQLTVGDFVDVQRESLKSFKRERIATWTENADLLDPSIRQQMVTEAFENAAKLSFRDLPTMTRSTPVKHDGKFVLNDDGSLKITKQACTYWEWWMSEAPEGVLFCVWLSVKKEPSQAMMNIDEVDSFVMEQIEDVAQEIGELSQPHLVEEILGNGETPRHKGRRGRRKKERGRTGP